MIGGKTRHPPSSVAKPPSLGLFCSTHCRITPYAPLATSCRLARADVESGPIYASMRQVPSAVVRFQYFQQRSSTMAKSIDGDEDVQLTQRCDMGKSYVTAVPQGPQVEGFVSSYSMARAANLQIAEVRLEL